MSTNPMHTVSGSPHQPTSMPCWQCMTTPLYTTVTRPHSPQLDDMIAMMGTRILRRLRNKLCCTKHTRQLQGADSMALTTSVRASIACHTSMHAPSNITCQSKPTHTMHTEQKKNKTQYHPLAAGGWLVGRCGCTGFLTPHHNRWLSQLATTYHFHHQEHLGHQLPSCSLNTPQSRNYYSGQHAVPDTVSEQHGCM